MVPKWIFWISIIIMLTYTLGFSIVLWKEKNKLGAFSIILLAIVLVTTPFFSILKK